MNACGGGAWLSLLFARGCLASARGWRSWNRARDRGSRGAYPNQVLPTPAFWSVFGDPASHNQRGRSVVAGRASTTLIERAAASFVAGRIDLEALPEGARQRHCAKRVAVPDSGSCTIACPAPRRTRSLRVLMRLTKPLPPAIDSACDDWRVRRATAIRSTNCPSSRPQRLRQLQHSLCPLHHRDVDELAALGDLGARG